MHRTSKNCISILRASHKIGSEYSPINRTKLLETILNSIFEEYEIPTFHSKKPDVKDCTFVLGYLCELLVLKNDFYFKEDFFKEKPAAEAAATEASAQTEAPAAAEAPVKAA